MSCYQEEHDACGCVRQQLEEKMMLAFEQKTSDFYARGLECRKSDMPPFKKQAPASLMLALLIIVVLAMGFDIASLKPHRQTTVQAAGYTLTGDVVVQAPGMKVEVRRVGSAQEVRVTK